MDDETHGEPQVAVDLAHPLGIALGQVVVDGDDVHTLAREGIEVGRQNGNQRLAFTGLHLGNATLMEHDAADDLHPVGAHAQHPVGRLPAGGKGLHQDIVQGFTVLKPCLEIRSLGLERLVGELAVFVLQRHDGVHLRHEFLDFPLGTGAEEFIDQSHVRQTFPRLKIKQLDYITNCPLKKGYSVNFPCRWENLPLCPRNPLIKEAFCNFLPNFLPSGHQPRRRGQNPAGDEHIGRPLKLHRSQIEIHHQLHAHGQKAAE